MREIRQGSGFPDWEIITGRERWFGWYNDQMVTELGWYDDDGRECRIVVVDSDRRVIRAAAGDRTGVLNLATVPGLIRTWRGSVTYGHTEWRVA